MNRKQKYVAPKIEMLLIVLEKCFNNFMNTYSSNKANDNQSKKSKLLHL
jgi:hypothetical protein